jgi:hypothetical protein
VAKERVFLYRQTTRSRDLTELFDSDPLAEALFYRLLAGSDDFGRLDWDVDLIRADCFPRSRRKPAAIEKALAALVERDMIFRYTVNGKDYLQITHYDDFQGEQGWARVKVACPPPPEWSPPESLVAFLDSTQDKRFLPERYGLVSECVGVYRAVSSCVPDTVRVPRAQARSHSPSHSHTHPPGAECAREEASPIPDPDPAFRQRDLRAQALAGDGHMLLANNPQVRELVARCCPDFTGPKVGDWATALLQAIRDPNTPLSREEWLAAFDADRPTQASKPLEWVNYHEKRAKAVNGKRARQAEDDPLALVYHPPPPDIEELLRAKGEIP